MEDSYNIKILSSTEEADKYRTSHLVEYVEPQSKGYRCIEVLPQLKGCPWDQYALSMINAVRPSSIRVIPRKSFIIADSARWWVTIYLEKDERTIRYIEQEVEVGCLGADHGYGLQLYSKLDQGQGQQLEEEALSSS